MARNPAVCFLGLALALTAGAAAAGEPGGRLEGAEAEAFLSRAEVTATRELARGITRSDLVTLSDGSRTAQAVWKTIDEHREGTTRFKKEGVAPEEDFRDSYRHEVAAYELDKLLGLGLVPPTVTRELKGDRGALQLWMGGTITETERLRQDRQPTDLPTWNERIYALRSFIHLLGDSDYLNMDNILVEPDFRVWVIDSSRGFSTRRTLLDEKELPAFSRTTLVRMAELDLPKLQQRLGALVDQPRLEALLARRDAIIALAKRRVEEKGEAGVLY